ncbi:hypothetical protein B0H14DRAFT_2831248, partial [Mycena olivaceomarginata]
MSESSPLARFDDEPLRDVRGMLVRGVSVLTPFFVAGLVVVEAAGISETVGSALITTALVEVLKGAGLYPVISMSESSSLCNLW